jgi:hypothetical protein
MSRPKPSGKAASAAPQSFLACLSQFLTPLVFKQAHQSLKRHRALRWHVQPLLFVLLTMTWCAGDSLPERFETARAFYVALHQRRRRPGKTFVGFQKALGKVPLPVLRTVATAVRRQVALVLAASLTVGGFIPLGCDGSRLGCCRSEELERRLHHRPKKKRKRKSKPPPASAPAGTTAEPSATPAPEPKPRKARTEPSMPQLWVTAVVHLSLGVLWSWRVDKGNADERKHLRRLVPTLPCTALLVADAAYAGYAVLAALESAGLSFLIRLSSRAPLYVEDKSTLKDYREGRVYYWPQREQDKEQPPIRTRLIRIATDDAAVWLLTNVLEERRLPRKLAGQMYRWRWRNEGLFRSYKRTLGKVKLMSRTVVQVRREAEGSLLATQLLLAQGAQALPQTARCRGELPSVRKVLVEIRLEIRNVVGMYLGPRQKRSYAERLAQARWPKRRQRSSKVRRRWPGRKDHRPPGKPKILKMGTILRDLAVKTLSAKPWPNC